MDKEKLYQYFLEGVAMVVMKYAGQGGGKLLKRSFRKDNERMLF